MTETSYETALKRYCLRRVKSCPGLQLFFRYPDFSISPLSNRKKIRDSRDYY